MPRHCSDACADTPCGLVAAPDSPAPASPDAHREILEEHHATPALDQYLSVKLCRAEAETLSTSIHEHIWNEAVRSRYSGELKIVAVGLKIDPAVYLRLAIRMSWGDLFNWYGPKYLAFAAASEGYNALLERLYKEKVAVPEAVQLDYAALKGQIHTVLMIRSLISKARLPRTLLLSAVKSRNIEPIRCVIPDGPDHGGATTQECRPDSLYVAAPAAAPAAAGLENSLRELAQSIVARAAELRSNSTEAKALAQHAQVVVDLALGLPEVAGNEALPSLLANIKSTLGDISRFLAEAATENVVMRMLSARKNRRSIKGFDARIAQLQQAAAETAAAAPPDPPAATANNADQEAAAAETAAAAPPDPPTATANNADQDAAAEPEREILADAPDLVEQQPDGTDAWRLVSVFPEWCARKGITAANAHAFDEKAPFGVPSRLEWRDGQLVCLNLVKEDIQGPLTPLIGGFLHLEKLHLTYNQITELPDSIGDLKELVELKIENNQLESLPASIVQLGKLQELSLRENKLASLPEDIGRLKGLVYLYLDGNRLKSLPESIGSLRKLEEIGIADNELKSLPDSIGGLKRLLKLELYKNQFESLPESICSLSKLMELSLLENKLTSLPDSIGGLKELTELELDDNQLESLPASIGSLSKLVELSLSENKLTSLPYEIGRLRELETLNLDKNQLESLPASIGGLRMLQNLRLAENRLTSIPDQISNLLQLEYLDLRNNRLVALPSGFKQTTIRHLWFDNNEVSEEELTESMELNRARMNKIRTAATRCIANAASAKLLASNAFALIQAPTSQPETAEAAATIQGSDAQTAIVETIGTLMEQTSEHSHLLQLLLAGKTATLISEFDKEMHASNAHSEAMSKAVEQDKDALPASIERFVAETSTKFDVQSHRLETLSAIKKHGGALLAAAPAGVREQLQAILNNANMDIVRRCGRGLSDKRDWTVDPEDVIILHSSKIGEGTLGEVYPARWRGKQVAVKVFPNAAGPAAAELIEREAFVWSQLLHDNVLRLHGVCLDADKPFVVMPFVREDAASLLTMARSISIEMRTTILLGIARGMQHLHKRQPPVIHGGLRANAARIADDGTVLISEFGMSLIKANSSRNTARRADNTRWVAPEAHISGYKLAKPSDVFSFAMTAVEVLTGDVPFGSSIASHTALAKIKAGERPSRPDGVPDALWKIIEDCWQQDAAARPRFDSVVEMLEKQPAVPLNLDQILTTQRMASIAEGAVAAADSCIKIAEGIEMGQEAFGKLAEFAESVASELLESLTIPDHGMSLAQVQAAAQSVADIKRFVMWIADISPIGQALLFWTTVDRIRRFGDVLVVTAESAGLVTGLDEDDIKEAINDSIEARAERIEELIEEAGKKFDVPSRRLETLSAIEAHSDELLQEVDEDLRKQLRRLLSATKKSLEKQVGKYLPASREWAVEPGSVQFPKSTRQSIGKGGFGEVHRGKWDGKNVAIKVIHDNNIKTQIDILEREICVWFSLQHDNVLPLLRVCLATEQPFFVMPLMECSAIDAVQKRPDMSIGERIGILLDTARGMRYLHERQPPVIHSDLRGDNVLIDSNGRAHVADFGLSFIKTSNNDDAWRRTGAVRWVAPEVHQKGYRMDLPSDVFSFAMTALEILTGKPPFEDGSNDGIVQDWIEEGERPYRPDDVPDDLWALIEGCWHHDPAARPTFREVVKRLESLRETANTDPAPQQAA
ncbi:U1 snRNP protein [Polyrhizophydium stewartii]|uniref:U1 snRNP protein n=1 Tax=Polyrhizophydium stewartii TaxID=2732419 RepID=A0ABR4NG93_9FUNG